MLSEFFGGTWPRRSLYVLMLLDIGLIAYGVFERNESFVFVGAGLSFIAGAALSFTQDVRKPK